MLADTYERLVNLDGKQILITGGYGFIGSHLAEQLASNNNVTIVDRSENQIGGEGMEGIEVIEGDLYDLSVGRWLFRVAWAQYSNQLQMPISLS